MVRRLRELALLLGALALAGAALAERPLQVITSTPDLADLVSQVGGAAVAVTSLAKGPQDPHFVEARPSFVRKLHDADLFVVIGMELEIGWAPALLRSARNPGVQPGAGGHLEAATAIEPLEVPQGERDRSMGDVHPYGNPHYLTDPINGGRVAALIRDRLTQLRPQQAAGFRARHADFERRLAEALVGAELARKLGPAETVRLVERDQLHDRLAGSGDSASLGGWLGALRPHAGVRAVQDHRLWPYFARRFGIELIGTFEPRPGIAPTTRHLAAVVQTMRERGAQLVLSSAYFDPRHARWVTERTEARIAEMAHQVGAQGGTDGYLATIDHNVRRVLAALAR